MDDSDYEEESGSRGSLSSSESEGASEYGDLKVYFKPATFNNFSSLEKKLFRVHKERYERAQLKGINLPMPEFMKSKSKRTLNAQKQPQKSKKRKHDKGSEDKENNPIEDGPPRKRRQTTVKPSNKEDKEDEVEDECFPGIKPYFTPSEWKGLSIIAKRHMQNAKDSYDKAVQDGLSPQVPKFMKRAAGSEAVTSGTISVEHPKASSSLVTPNSVGYHLTSSTSSTSTGKFDRRMSTNVLLSDANPSSSSQSFMQDLSLVDELSASLTLENVGQDSTYFDPTIMPDGLNDCSLAGWLDGNERIPEVVEGAERSSSENGGGIRADIQSIIKEVLPNISPISLMNIVNTLIDDKGVETKDDLSLVEASWLENFNLKEIQIKKIIQKFKCVTESSNEKKTASTKKPAKEKAPLLREPVVPQSIASRPHLAQKVTEVGVIDLVIVWGKMRDSLLTSLEKKERPKSTDRDNMVLVISKDIKDCYEKVKSENPTLKQKTPGRKVYKAVTQSIFNDFEISFQDVIRGKKSGDGMFSLTDQIETCVENMYRARVPSHMRSSVPVKGNRNAACILPSKFAPPLTKEQKAHAEQTRRRLTAMYQGPTSDWDWDFIKEKLREDACLGVQRALINDKKRNLADIQEKWPFLFELNGMLAHLEEITGTPSLLENFERFLDADLDNFINYLTSMSPKNIANMKIHKVMSTGNGEHRRVLAFIMMAANHFNEDFKVLLNTVEETTMPHEVVDEISDLPASPSIVALGPCPFLAKQFYLLMDGVCMCTVNNALEAVMVLCASYFVFGVLYPSQASATLLLIERLIANLDDASGATKATTSNGGVSRSCLSRVRTLITNVEKFEQDLNGDD